jgi:hypothetical protein
MKMGVDKGDQASISRPRVGRPGRALGWLLLLLLAVFSIWLIDRQAMQTNNAGAAVATEGIAGAKPSP